MSITKFELKNCNNRCGGPFSTLFIISKYTLLDIYKLKYNDKIKITTHFHLDFNDYLITITNTIQQERMVLDRSKNYLGGENPLMLMV